VYGFASSHKLPPKTLQIMNGKLPDLKQASLFEPNLHQIVNPAHELVLLAEKIEWEYFDHEFSSHYSHKGKPSVPVRVMVSLLLLKHIYNLGDETVMEALKYASMLRPFKHQLAQKKKDAGKIYSFHAPHSYCIAKGKEQKPYEFGTKASIGSTLHTGIIVGAFCLKENDYDGHTLPAVLEQTQRLLKPVIFAIQ
jgi:hypothetical protein